MPELNVIVRVDDVRVFLPKSDLLGEQSWSTQPIPTKPPPLECGNLRWTRSIPTLMRPRKLGYVVGHTRIPCIAHLASAIGARPPAPRPLNALLARVDRPRHSRVGWKGEMNEIQLSRAGVIGRFSMFPESTNSRSREIPTSRVPTVDSNTPSEDCR